MEDRIDSNTRNAVLNAMVEGTKKKEPSAVSISKPGISERVELKSNDSTLRRVTEEKVVKQVIQKAHDFPIGIFWYDTKNDVLDYTPYTEGLHHSKTTNFKKYSTDPLTLRGRVFKDGPINVAFIYIDDFKSMEYLKSRLPTLAQRLFKKDNIKYLVSEYGEDLLEKVKTKATGSITEKKTFGEMLAESLKIKEGQENVEEEEISEVREVAIKAANMNVIKEWRF